MTSFRREWVRELFAAAADDVRRQCAATGKELHFKLFERYEPSRRAGPAAEKLSYAGFGPRSSDCPRPR